METVKPTHELRQLLKGAGFKYNGTYAVGDEFSRTRVDGEQGHRTYTDQLVKVRHDGTVAIYHRQMYVSPTEPEPGTRIFDAPVSAKVDMVALLDNIN